MRTIKEILKDQEVARARVEQLDNEWNDAIRELAGQVDVVQRGETVTLTFQGRVLKAKKNRRNAWVVRENGRVLQEYSASLRLLKAAVAQGTI